MNNKLLIKACAGALLGAGGTICFGAFMFFMERRYLAQIDLITLFIGSLYMAIGIILVILGYLVLLRSRRCKLI